MCHLQRHEIEILSHCDFVSYIFNNFLISPKVSKHLVYIFVF